MTTTKPKPYLLTSDGLRRLTDELNRLRTEGREAVAERLRRAFADGQDDDFVDNAELEAARHEQSFLEGRILELEQILSNYQIIDHMEMAHDSVRVGDWVTVVEVGTTETERYMIVGAAEADPAAGRISNESPLGKSLLGKKKGDEVVIVAPRGQMKFRVVEIG
ncbi:MAG: transcription elongation factor GreA [Anaerolineales bacterium]|nr:transcription elongation factor GreA [Anaerolineales bacterium]MCB8951709.1 transcription elongation factor GreA [Ardenticatenales bacterium]